MSISSEIQRINTNIANAYTKAEEKGATLPVTQNSANLASTIESITGTTPTGTITITQDGTYDVSNYATAIVNTSPHTVLNYIQSTGTQYIITDYIPNHNTKYIIQMSNHIYTSKNFGNFFAANKTFSTSNVMFNEQTNAEEKTWLYGSTPVEITYDDQSSLHKYEFYRSSVKRDNISISSDTSINSNVVFNYLTFFTDNVSLSLRVTKYRLHDFKCYDESTGNLIRWYRPVQKKDGTICLYEEIEGKYFYNQGTGTFLGG